MLAIRSRLAEINMSHAESCQLARFGFFLLGYSQNIENVKIKHQDKRGSAPTLFVETDPNRQIGGAAPRHMGIWCRGYAPLVLPIINLLQTVPGRCPYHCYNSLIFNCLFFRPELGLKFWETLKFGMTDV